MNELNEDTIIGFDADSFEYAGELTLVASVLGKLGCSIVFTGSEEELQDSGISDAVILNPNATEDIRFDVFFQNNFSRHNVDTAVLIYT